MTEFQYCYWLMGVIELGSIESLNKKQMFFIREHLALVENRQYAFCNWFDGFLDAHDDCLNAQQFNKVKRKLSQEFRDVIDVSYDPSILEELNAAHTFNLRSS